MAYPFDHRRDRPPKVGPASDILRRLSVGLQTPETAVGVFKVDANH
jgi:hypothetical protein